MAYEGEPTAWAQSPLDEAKALNARAVELYNAGKAGNAIPLAKRALEVREAALRAFVSRVPGQLAEAEPLFKRALAMTGSALPAGLPDIATSLNTWTQTLPDWIGAHTRVRVFRRRAGDGRVGQSEVRHYEGLLPRAEGQPLLRGDGHTRDLLSVGGQHG